MKYKLSDIPSEFRYQLKEVIRQSKRSGQYLSSSKNNAPFPSLLLLAILPFYILILIYLRTWEPFYYVLIGGFLILILLLKQTLRYIHWKSLGGDAIFFDSKNFFSINNNDLFIYPLNEYKDLDFILSQDEHYHLIRIHFDSKIIIQPLKEINSKKSVHFYDTLLQKINALRLSEPKYYWELNEGINAFRKLSPYFIPGFITVFSIIILWLLLPSIIDTNAFNFAKGLDTATAYRHYLTESKNTLYRDEAKENIMVIYDKYITKYKNTVYTLDEGTEAFINILKYLRDNNVFNVSLRFNSSSLVDDLYTDDTYYNIIPITPSFTEERNASRENDVFRTIQSSFGQLFPTDIFHLNNSKNNLVPQIKVAYSYKNKSQSLYYPVEQEYIPDEQKTWYYGIEIEWFISIYLPNSDTAIFEYGFESVPAQEFESEIYSPLEVYNDMALSAFNDFENSFVNQFLN